MRISRCALHQFVYQWYASADYRPAGHADYGSFVATTHALWWNGIKPVFVDIDPETCNLDPDKIEAAITPHTTAIMPVHVYGRPCDTARIQEIADKYGLKVIYDAAHAFGVKVGGESILNAGDMSTLSFHATKSV